MKMYQIRNILSKIAIFTFLFSLYTCGNICDDCIQSSSEMSFCYKKDYDGRRCDRIENFKFCPPEFIERNQDSSIYVIENQDFRNFEVIENKESYIQFKPQKVKLHLKKGDAVNFTFSYKPAKNYPLELYYLMDLTYSMKNDVETLVNLGEELGYSLKDISEHFKIAFGSYVDKVLMPFSLTNKASINNPCNQADQKYCAKSYLIKHIQNFTNDLDLFTKEVQKKSNTSANLDDLEGGMEALLQVVLCGKRIGWSEISRKFVIISTGSFMHLAGDGLLSGTVRRNTGKCLIDSQGNYPADNLFDYPSLEEIHKHLRKQKVNVIFAVKPKVRSYYESLEEIISDSAFVGTLENNSKNIIQLTRVGYMDFFKQAKFSVDSNHTADLEIKFYANCSGFGFVETSTCSNVVLDNVINFIAEIKLNDFPAGLKEETLFIVEKNIQENITVNLEYFGICSCSSMNYTLEKDAGCVNGDLRCGECVCHQGWTGDFCNLTCSNSLDPCRRLVDGFKETSCSRRGDCECGRCICDFPYRGKYCEFKCPVYMGKICSNHGECVDTDTCRCDSKYTGKDCSCENSTTNCMVFGKICNNHGNCKCNKCTCDENYKGNKCEYYVGNKELKGFCSEFLNQTLDFVENGTVNSFYQNISITTEKVADNLKIEGEGVCFVRFTKAANYCEINYRYNLENHPIKLEVQSSCRSTVNAAIVAPAIIVVIIFFGFICALIWKCITIRNDNLEYQQFEKELSQQKRVKMENPLYTSPITSYTVPLTSVKEKSG